MEMLFHALAGFQVALLPVNLLYTAIGVLVGTIVGILPGLGPSATIAMLIPITYGMDPTSALIMLAGVYYGSMYGGSASAILINTPGESASVMTALDGYQMARKGRAGAALAVAAIGSFIAGTIGIIALTALSFPIADFALRFGPAEYFMLMLFAMTAASALAGRSIAKAMIATTLGLMLSTVGADMQTSVHRFTAGVATLIDGVSFLVVAVGLFAFGEVFRNIEDISRGKIEIVRVLGKLWLTAEEWRRSLNPILRGSVIGFIVGALPGAGTTIGTILSYVAERKLAKRPEEFGSGAIEGVAGPEAANNSCTAGAMVPMLTLGLPGSASTAVLLGAFTLYGIQPGPLLFQQRPDLVWGLIDSMYVGNVILLVLNLPLIGLFVRLLYVPSGILMPLIIVIAAVGVYNIKGDPVELHMALAFGALGYVLQKSGFPLALLLLGIVLGPGMEQSFRQALAITGGDPTVFVSSSISVALIVLSVAAVALPFLLSFAQRRKAGTASAQL